MADIKLESLSTLFAGIAHDVNNLLGAIAARAESAQASLAPGSPAAMDVEQIHRTARRAAEMVAHVFKISNGDEASPNPIDLSETVSETLEMIRSCVSQTATLQTELAPGLSVISVDKSDIRCITMNLVINASESLGGEPGVVTVRTAQAELSPGSAAVLLEVEDTGCGMSEAVKKRAFEALFTTRPGGHGLGLAAVKTIVDRRHGIIQVHSSPGKGSRFSIVFPCRQTLVQSGSDAAATAAPPQNGGLLRYVLMIEDEAALRDPVSRMLRREGIHVTEASTAEDGIAALQNGDLNVDAVILDLTLPGMSGLEVLRELRQLRPDMRVIITSAYGRGTVESRMRCDDSWVYLQKPYRMTELLALMNAGPATADGKPASAAASA